MKATISLKNQPEIITDSDVARKYISMVEGAERRGKDFELTLNDVRKMLKVKKCQYTGVTLARYLCTDGVANSNGRTIDRLDPSIGYVKGNVYVVSHVANSIKNVLFEDNNSVVRLPFKGMVKLMGSLSKLGFKEEM